MDETNFWISLIASIALIAIVFLAIRGIMLWYWKINEIIKYQEEQSELLSQIKNILREQKE